MNEEHEKVRCRQCELVQWSDRQLCRRCGESLPQPIVKIVERVVERIVFRQCAPGSTNEPGEVAATSDFPTMAEMERAMVLAAYQRSNQKPIEAARLLGIGKSTVYRKLRELRQMV